VTANFYAIPELAAQYDVECGDRADLDFYVRLAEDLGAARVADVGAGTGLLCTRLADHGHEVIGVEPQPTMLQIARRRPSSGAVTWIHGTARDLPTGWADLVVMTGHVAQYFLDDDAWRDVLADARRALRRGGHVAFEIRNPAVEAWRAWASADPVPTRTGTVRTEVHRRGDLVTHVDHWTRGDRSWTTTETLRFPSWHDVTAGIAAAGLEIAHSWGDWDRTPPADTAPEWVLLTREAVVSPGARPTTVRDPARPAPPIG